MVDSRGGVAIAGAMKDFSIVFDLDGTLVDTAPDLIAVSDQMLAEMGSPPLPVGAGRVAAGQGARALLTAGLAAHGLPLPGDDEWPGLIADFIARYQARIAELSRPFPGAREFLERAREKGARLAVCTNKKDFLAVELLRRLELADYFHSITGANTTGVGKPRPEPLLHCLREAGGRPERAVLIGDSMADVAAARAASVIPVLADWGYLDRAADEYGADYRAASLDEALGLCMELAG